MSEESSAGTRRRGPLRLLLSSLAIIGLISVGAVGAYIVFYQLVMAPFLQAAEITKARAEVMNAQVALEGMLSDAGVTSFPLLFADFQEHERSTTDSQVSHHTEIMYDLLRNGRNASVELAPQKRQLLGSSYLALMNDPWENRYQFLIPSWDNVTGLSGAPAGWNVYIWSFGPDQIAETDDDIRSWHR